MLPSWVRRQKKLTPTPDFHFTNSRTKNIQEAYIPVNKVGGGICNN